MSENVFADEWRDCLRAHYIHVIRTADRVTEPSLTLVMQQAGFSDTELAEFRVRATMHIDDVGEDFVPDMDVLAAVEEQAAEAHIIAIPELPIEPPPKPEAMLADEKTADEELPPIEEAPIESEPEDDPDAPQQLSLF